MLKMNEGKSKPLRTVDDRYDEQYGLPGTPSRMELEYRAKAWY